MLCSSHFIEACAHVRVCVLAAFPPCPFPWLPRAPHPFPFLPSPLRAFFFIPYCSADIPPMNPQSSDIPLRTLNPPFPQASCKGDPLNSFMPFIGHKYACNIFSLSLSLSLVSYFFFLFFSFIVNPIQRERRRRRRRRIFIFVRCVCMPRFFSLTILLNLLFFKNGLQGTRTKTAASTQT